MKDEFLEKATKITDKFKHCSNCNSYEMCTGSPGMYRGIKKALQAEYRRGRESMREEAAKIASNLDCEGCYAEHYSSNYPPGFFDYNKAAEAIRGIEV